MDDIGNGYFVHMHFLYQVPSTTKYSTHTVITFATLTKALTTNNNFLKSGCSGGDGTPPLRDNH